MYRAASIVIALIVLAAGGLAHGVLAERTQSSPALNDAAARVDKVPLKIGDWQGHTVDTDAEPFVQTGALSHWTRSYVHERRQAALLVILMCGRSGRMAVHTPEVCYRGAGYETTSDPVNFEVKSPEGEVLGTFWTARFVKETAGGGDLRLAWSWNAGYGWRTPSNPRWEFGGRPFLYKLYISEDSPAGAANGGAPLTRRSATTEAAQDFMRQFLPQLQQTLLETTE